jgi:phospholipase/lecithinase/hemolysin
VVACSRPNSATVQDQYLFWDHLHPTETGHLAIAAEAEEQLSHITIDNLIRRSRNQQV